MGNRAVITTRKGLKDIGVYLHWNGGRDSVEGFLTYCKIKGYRPPEYDNYGWAYLCMTIGNFFGGEGFSLGIDVASKLDCDNWDNGTYIIKDWKIVDRLYRRRREQNVYPLMDMLLSIDEKQPNPLGEDAIKAALAKIEQEETADDDSTASQQKL